MQVIRGWDEGVAKVSVIVYVNRFELSLLASIPPLFGFVEVVFDSGGMWEISGSYNKTIAV